MGQVRQLRPDPTASSIERTGRNRNPATSSPVAGNGPSTAVQLGPEKRTRFPCALGLSPSPARMMPAWTSSSWYHPIAVDSSRGALVYRG